MEIPGFPNGLFVIVAKYKVYNFSHFSATDHGQIIQTLPGSGDYTISVRADASETGCIRLTRRFMVTIP